MTDSGVVLDLSDFGPGRVDKHSTGGVGDKTSLVLAPLAAACGVIVPMMSGRGLGHTGGTLDKLEAIPGFRVNLSIPEFRQALQHVGTAMISQTAEVAPADKKLYALRDVTGTVESIPLITASILSKKLAEGITGLVLDVKFGDGAFMKSRPAARELAQSLVKVGTANGLRVHALLTAMQQPLGQMIGNALEVREAIDVLRGGGPADLVELCLILTTRLVRLAGKAEDDITAQRQVREALSSGQALDRFRLMVQQQGGNPHIADDPTLLPIGPHQEYIKADRSGYLHQLYAERIGLAGVALGAGRRKVEDEIVPSVGIQLHARVGQFVHAGSTLMTVHYRDATTLPEAITLLKNAIVISDGIPSIEPLIAEEF